jgi:hypothetical protein
VQLRFVKARCKLRCPIWSPKDFDWNHTTFQSYLSL